MIPTLSGRWQTRILLYLFIGLPITLLYAYWLELDADFIANPFIFLTTIMALGLLLDVLYIQIQRFRWDNDWPFAFQLFFSFLEFFIVYGLMSAGWLDDLLGGGMEGRIDWGNAITHFILVFIPSFLALLGFAQVFLPRWRYKGGELGHL